MHNKQTKFDSDWRVQELSPIGTLKTIGLGSNDVFCDIGAGSGIFTIPAAKITKNTVYALELSDEMLSILFSKAKEEGLTHINVIKVEENRFKMPDRSVDITLLSNIIHELDNIPIFLKEVKRILKPEGKIAIIEFHKRKTPMGPPFEHRIEKNIVIEHLNNFGYAPVQDFDLGDNYYCLVFKANNKLI